MSGPSALQKAPSSYEADSSAGTNLSPEVKKKTKTLNEILTEQINTLIDYRSRVIDTSEPEAIHKLRVTTRRLQSSLDLIQSEDPDGSAQKADALIKKLKGRLRQTRRKLADLRNTDVFLEMLAEHKPRHGHGNHLQLLVTFFKAKRDRYAEEAKAYLQKRDFDNLGEIVNQALSTLVSYPNTDAKPEDVHETGAVSSNPTLSTPPADSKRIKKRTAVRLENRLSEFLRLALASHPGSNPADLHQVRIAAKRLRYLFELVSMLQLADFEKELAWLRTLQDKIGEWHDFHAIEEEIITTVSRRSFIREHLAGSADLLRLAARFRARRLPLARKLFPIRPPRVLTAHTNRLIRSLHRDARA